MQALIGHDLLRTLTKNPPTTITDVYDTKLKGFVLRWRPSGKHSYLTRTPRGWYVIARAAVLSPEKARKRAQALLGDVANGKDPLAEKAAARARLEAAKAAARQAATPEPGQLLLRDYLSAVYEPWADANLKTGEATIKRLTGRFGSLLDVPLNELTPWHLESWKTARRKAKKVAKTINRDVSDLKAMLARATLWGHLPAHPLAKVKPEKVDRRAGWIVRYLSPEEEKRLRAALASRDERHRLEREKANVWRRKRKYPELPALGEYTDHLTPLVLLALNTGLRRGELLALTWGTVDWAHKLLSVRGDTAKTGQTRHVDLNDEAMAVLKTWREVQGRPGGDALVFPGPKKGAEMGDVKTAWTALLEEAKVKRFRFHDLRHTFASKLVQRGVPLQVVAELLGHASILMTQRYAHLAPSQKRAAVDLLAKEA